MSRRDEDGAVTAETAAVIPVLVVMAMALAWLVALGVAQVRVVDAARETARALARGEAPGVSEGYGRRVAPQGARFRIRVDGGDVEVQVTSTITGPGGIFGFLPGFEAHSRAFAQAEP